MKQIFFIAIIFILNCSNNSDFCSGDVTAPGCSSKKGEAMEALVDIVKKKTLADMYSKNQAISNRQKFREDFSTGTQGYESYGYGTSGNDGDGIIGN